MGTEQNLKTGRGEYNCSSRVTKSWRLMTELWQSLHTLEEVWQIYTHNESSMS